MKTIPVRSSYLRILAIRYQGARKDRLLLERSISIIGNTPCLKTGNLSSILRYFKKVLDKLNEIWYTCMYDMGEWMSDKTHDECLYEIYHVMPIRFPSIPEW